MVRCLLIHMLIQQGYGCVFFVLARRKASVRGGVEGKLGEVQCSSSSSAKLNLLVTICRVEELGLWPGQRKASN